MKQKHKKKSETKRQISLERIKTLFNQAKHEFSNDPRLSNKYVNLAKKIAMKSKIKMPSIFKRQYCKYCYSYLMQGKNVTVRTTTKTITYTCMNCNRYTRIGYKQKPKKAKKNI
jgi:ribonuclease P protein subunit RPR2